MWLVNERLAVQGQRSMIPVSLITVSTNDRAHLGDRSPSKLLILRTQPVLGLHLLDNLFNLSVVGSLAVSIEYELVFIIFSVVICIAGLVTRVVARVIVRLVFFGLRSVR